MTTSKDMTITAPIDGTRGRFDWTRPVLGLFAACLIVLIALPPSGLALYAFPDKAGHVTLMNFVTLLTNTA